MDRATRAPFGAPFRVAHGAGVPQGPESSCQALPEPFAAPHAVLRAAGSRHPRSCGLALLRQGRGRRLQADGNRRYFPVP